MSQRLRSDIREYRLVDYIGGGGMGEVYRAVHRSLGRIVALKVLAPSVMGDHVCTERFIREAQIQARLAHPGVASLVECFEWEGRPIIVMEYVDGLTLHELLAVRHILPYREALRIARAIAETLAYVHAEGIIHRDLKPANIKISSLGEVKLLDFGIARAAGDAGLTRTGNVVGTFESVSPEQVRGKAATPASDIWALGVVIYEMVVGRPPFRGDDPVVLFKKIASVDYEHAGSALTHRHYRSLPPQEAQRPVSFG